MSELARRLGHQPDTRLVILNCDDLGMTQSTNDAIYRALRHGCATSASLMVPGPWARSAAADYRGEDVGVHLTLTAEFDLFRWGPLTFSPSLVGGDGGSPSTVEDFWEHADLDEVRRECRVQIERAILWGFDVSHLDSHFGSLQLRPEFFDIYLDLAVDFRLPVRLAGADAERFFGFPFRTLAEEEGILAPDHLVAIDHAPSRPYVERAIAELPPGVTEFALRPACDTAELRATGTDWQSRVDDLDLLTAGHLQEQLAAAGVVRIGWRELRAAQLAG